MARFTLIYSLKSHVKAEKWSLSADQRLMLLESNERNEALLRELEQRCHEHVAVELKDLEATQLRFSEARNV